MTPERIRIVIAEFCGLTAYDDCPSYGFENKKGKAKHIPNYPSSKDAMHEAKKKLSENQKDVYILALDILVEVNEDEKWSFYENAWKRNNASALQEATAFVKAIGKYEE